MSSFIKSGQVPPPLLLSVPASVSIAAARTSMSLAGTVNLVGTRKRRKGHRAHNGPPPTILELRAMEQRRLAGLKPRTR